MPGAAAAVLKKAVAKWRVLGTTGLCLCAFKRFRLRLLQRRYGFPRWFVASPFECRPYKRVVVEIANDLGPNAVVEIGCGLGEIIHRIEAPAKYGFDIDQKAINAAEALHGKGVAFRTGSFRQAAGIPEPFIDVLIMVNWLHDIAGYELRREVDFVLARKSVRFLLVDAIEPGIPGYKHRHDYEECFRGLAKKVEEVEDRGEGVRKIVLMEVTRGPQEPSRADAARSEAPPR